jgi:hypothetical protein
VIDGAALGVCGGDAVADEPLVQGQVRQRPVLWQPVRASLPGCYAIIGGPHVPCWSVGGLPAELSAVWFVLAVEVEVAGRLGRGFDCLWTGEAEFGGPALDMRPEPVALADTLVGSGISEDHGRDGGVAV